MTSTQIRNPDLAAVLGQLLPSLPAAALSPKPADTVLPILSPILRQRVQLLSDEKSDSWIGLLCYDAGNVARLKEIAQSSRLELHPVSGEIEVDWDYDAEMRYRRLDEETLQALVALGEIGISFRLVHCTGDPEGDGWKVGEVSVVEQPSPFASFGGVSSIAEAERQFNESKQKTAPTANGASGSQSQVAPDEKNDDDDDDDYWAQYDATPAGQTPATKRSPAPQSIQGQSQGVEQDYYSQYDSVQPAMDNHDPDEEANLPDDIVPAPPLGLARSATQQEQQQLTDRDVETLPNETQGAWTLASPPKSPHDNHDNPNLVHPHPSRPSSSASSRASVEKLEAVAERQQAGEFGVKQHISRSIKSLYMLSRASGIDRTEFESMVKTEIDLLGMLDEN